MKYTAPNTAVIANEAAKKINVLWFAASLTMVSPAEPIRMRTKPPAFSRFSTRPCPQLIKKNAPTLATPLWARNRWPTMQAA